MVKTISNSWKTERDPDIDSIHPPFEPVLVDGEIHGSPIKLFATSLKKTSKVEHLGQIIEQQNFTNLALSTIGRQTERIENILLERKEEAGTIIRRFSEIQR